MKRRLLLSLCLLAAAVAAIGPVTRADSPPPTCTLVVPPNPLSAQGLATPYQLLGCSEVNPDTSAFVQAAILAPDGKLAVYPPLVITAGRTALVAPVVPVVPEGSTVALWFGFNGDSLGLSVPASTGTDPDAARIVLAGTGAADANCVNGAQGTLFGQFSYCNAPAFFAAANAAIARGTLHVPPLGTDHRGEPCPTVRSYKITDQDPSDNVQTQYLRHGGNTIQNTAWNRWFHSWWKIMSNPSDNRLLTALVDPAIGCTPWLNPDLADGGRPVASLAADELQAAAYQGAPIGYVPLGDPMTAVNGVESVAKTNAYRVGVDQPLVSPGPTAGDDASYCSGLADVGAPFLQANAAALAARPSPFPLEANSLLTFVAARFVATFETAMVNPCAGTDPVSVTTDASGVVVGVTFG